MGSRIRSTLDPGDHFLVQKVERSRDDPAPHNRNGLALVRLKRVGKKVSEWDRIRAVLKKRFEKAGIRNCELNYDGCWRTTALGFAHAKKRRNCSKADLWVTILACNICHDHIEILPEVQMEAIVMDVIFSRRVPV